MLKLTDQSRAFHHNFLSDFLHDILDKVNTIIGITFPNTECTPIVGIWDVSLAEYNFNVQNKITVCIIPFGHFKFRISKKSF